MQSSFVVPVGIAPDPYILLGVEHCNTNSSAFAAGFRIRAKSDPRLILQLQPQASELRRLTGNGQNFCGWDEPLGGICLNPKPLNPKCCFAWAALRLRSSVATALKSPYLLGYFFKLFLPLSSRHSVQDIVNDLGAFLVRGGVLGVEHLP